MLTYFVLVVLFQSNPPVFGVLDYYTTSEPCEKVLVKVIEDNDDPKLTFKCLEWVAPKDQKELPTKPKPTKKAPSPQGHLLQT